MKAFLDRIPYSILIPVAVLLGLAPFFPQPHVVEKIRMLANGELRRPIDIIDLIMHLSPVLLLLYKWLDEKFNGRDERT
ncbi:MAG: hypothetical protein A2X84_09555 [Desulfuromonadaceae bacterium GWC2_58_13]|nr:MAG: hypothetical protein A2X84_09555 [Desulfuromonadaceae bacterium GWC2_58_13]